MDDNEDLSEFGEKPFPPVSEALVTHLELLFPNRCPEMTDPDRLIWVKSGQHTVVKFLRARFEEQQP